MGYVTLTQKSNDSSWTVRYADHERRCADSDKRGDDALTKLGCNIRVFVEIPIVRFVDFGGC